MGIALVLFDVNGVLYRYDKSARIAHLAALTGKPPQVIDAAIWGSGFEDAGDAGAMDAAAYLQGFGDRLATRLRLQDWRAAMQAAVSPIMPMLDLARGLAGHVRLGVLTNNNLLIRERLDDIYPALRPIFGNAICVSASFGLRKPDPALYQACANWLGLQTQDILFVDDAAANVAGAERAGMQAHLYQDEVALRSGLQAASILPP